MDYRILAAGIISLAALAPTPANPDTQRVEVPASAAADKNPLPITPRNIQQGKDLYHGKAYCVACHGPAGKGLGDDSVKALLKGRIPPDFTSPAWQSGRSDGELMWILKHGSEGTAMARFVPGTLTEQEGWKVIIYLRSLVEHKSP